MMFTAQNITSEIEEQRLLALYSYDILGDGLEHELDNLIKLAAQIAQVPTAYAAFVDRTEVVLRAVFGDMFFSQNNFPRNNDVVSQFSMWNEDIFLVQDTLLHDVLSKNTMVVNEPHIRFYCAVPLKDSKGFPLGSLTLLDVVPRHLDEKALQALKTVAAQVINQLELKRKNTELLIQTKKYQEFKDIFTVSPEIHCILDRNGEILFINKAVTKLLQYKVTEVTGKSIWRYCHPDDLTDVIHAVETGLVAKIKEFSIDFRLVSKVGQFKWIGWTMVAKEGRWYCYGRDITEIKRVEKELLKLSFVASKINNGVVINDANNNVSWVNDAFEKITGFNLEDLKGKPLADLISGPQTDMSIIENARTFTQNKQSFTVDLLAYRKDKQPIWLSVYHTVVLDEDGKVETDVEIIIDITEKKKVEEELQILSLVASKSNTGVTIADENGKITWVNKALENLTGYSLAELKGKMLGDVLSTNNTNKDIILAAREKVANLESSTIEVSALKKDGTMVWLSASNTPVLNAKGQLERQVELINDITQRKKVEQEIIESRAQAIQLSEAKEMFLSVMSHEIRTSLNAVIGMTHLLLENDPKPSQIDDLNILKFSSENLLNIINDILDFTKIETGNLELESIPFDLHTLCVDIINSLQVNAGKRGNLLSLTYDYLIPNQLLGDKTRLYQILMNLLGNAIKFTEGGKIQLLLKLQKTKKEQSTIYFEVRDNGIGIPKDKLSYIFETFTQARADISRKYGGTGLGLAITKKLIKLYNSDIKVQSTEGKGTIFSFAISFKKVSEAALIVKPVLLQNNFSTKKILVVDDNEVNILIAKRFLSKWGFIIDFAVNGEEAIHKIIENTYDLVFMDIRMPGIDGFDATKIIREMPGDYFQNLPIIALTASTLHDENMKFKEAGMNGHILKPFNPDEIKDLLASYFN